METGTYGGEGWRWRWRWRNSNQAGKAKEKGERIPMVHWSPNAKSDSRDASQSIPRTRHGRDLRSCQVAKLRVTFDLPGLSDGIWFKLDGSCHPIGDRSEQFSRDRFSTLQQMRYCTFPLIRVHQPSPSKKAVVSSHIAMQILRDAP